MDRFKFRTKEHKERGIALIIVISMMTVMLLVAFSMMAESSVSQLSGRTLSARGNMKYKAESMISRSLWCYMWDRKKFQNAHRGLGKELEERSEEDGRAWLANGNPYNFIDTETNTAVIVKIHDAIQGTDIDSSHRPGMDIRKQKYIKEMEDEERLEKIYSFTYALDDYIDRNEYYSSQEYHYEMEDYEQNGMMNFPANNKIQVREEVYWMDNIDIMASDDIGKITGTKFRVVAPRTWKKGPDQTLNTSVYSAKSTTKPSLFATSESSIKQQEDIDEEQLEELQDLKGGKILWSEMSSEAQSALRQYSRDESGICTFEATGLMYNGEMSRTIKVTFDCTSLLNVNNKNYFTCWEQIIY